MEISGIKTFLRGIFLQFYNFVLFASARLIPVNILNFFMNSSLLPPSLAIKFMSRMDPAFLEYLSEKRTLFLFKRAWESVPAYKNFLDANNIKLQDIRTIEDFNKLVPQTKKDNYIRKYRLAERCLRGKLPGRGFLEESAGTSGTPTNWIRSAAEEKVYDLLTKITVTYLYPLDKSRRNVLLNGFLLGAWAGGQRFSSRIGPFGIIKNIGPDAKKVIQTIQELGTEQNYLICGYPPFLKELIDLGKKMGRFDWKDYHVHLLTGGEGFVEEWRDYVASELKKGARIYSLYGAIDLEVGIAVETPLSIAIRKVLNKDYQLRMDLLSINRFPCFLGQYSPLNFFINESINKDNIKESEITVLNFKSISPKIKYNVGDEGGVIRFNRMKEILKKRGYDFSHIAKDSSYFLLAPMPFLYLFGRSDGTVSINGATISPTDIYKAILSDDELASKINTFKLSVEMDVDRSIRLFIYLEAHEGAKVTEVLAKKCNQIIVSKLLESNECFRLSYGKNPEASRPVVLVLPFRSGIFKDRGELPKYKYIKR